MQIKAGFNIAFNCVDYTPMVLMLHVRPERAVDLLMPEIFTLSPPHESYRNYLDVFGNLCSRLIAPPGPISIWSRFVINDSGLAETLPHNAWQHPVPELPDDTVMFLMGSRYCDTQKLMPIAWSLFGGYPDGWPRIQAVLEYTHNRIQFSYSNARNDRTAWEAHEEQTGVCRDYTHLAITLFRCLNIPARYCTGYLGDIGVPFDRSPMDFSAWLEVFMGGQWWTLDARHNQARIGRILIGKGRDAADVAISTTFGNAMLTEFSVITEEMIAA
jgi:transglutaminase-like putative cysteine protease